jgi:hypothetical protein
MTVFALWTARVFARSAVRPGAWLQLAIGISRPRFFDPPAGHPLAVGAW